MNLPANPGRLHTGLAQVADPARLATAWADVLASDEEDGVLGQGVTRFAEDADEYLGRMAADLRSGTYEPGQLIPVNCPARTAG
jgi:hypothetical protein